jgi:hypothetical protein
VLPRLRLAPLRPLQPVLRRLRPEAARRSNCAASMIPKSVKRFSDEIMLYLKNDHDGFGSLDPKPS